MNRPFALPLVPVYATAVALKNAAYDHRLLAMQKLSRPVISVGNLSAGGTGKTPFVMLLARLLAERGWEVDVLSRGYGRRSRAIARVDPRGTVEQYGDEPLLMARCGLAVYVGADRYRAGILAEKSNNNPTVHLLDDGFQHRKLARTVNIVLVQGRDLEDHLLPAGNLRESFRAIRRADICILPARSSRIADRVLREMRLPDPGHIWTMERRTTLSRCTGKGMAFCAIGDPAGFFDALHTAGVELVGKIAFADHHIFSRKDIAQLTERARVTGAQFFVTTEKDAVRLPGDFRAEMESQCPLMLAGLEISLVDESNAMATLIGRLQNSPST